MNNDNLSQDEINALLAEIPPGDSGSSGFSQDQLDLLRDRLGLSLASGGEALGVLFGSPVFFGLSQIQVNPAGTIIPSLKRSVCVRVDFVRGLNGTAYFIFPEDHALQIARILMGDDSITDFGPIPQSSVGEAVGQLLGAVCTRLSQIIGANLSFAPPEVLTASEAGNAIGSEFPAEANLVRIDIRMDIDEKMTTDIILLLQMGLAEGLATGATAGAAAQPSPAAVRVGAPPQPVAPASAFPFVPTQAAVPDSLTRAIEGFDPAGQPTPHHADSAVPVAVQAPNWQDLGRGSISSEAQNIELLLDVPLQITVELGRTRRKIRDVLAMGPGSVVELDRLAGEAVDVLVNGKLIAKGEVVVIDENFGVRITDIVSPAERVRNL